MRGKRERLDQRIAESFSHGYRFLVMIKQVSLRREIVSFLDIVAQDVSSTSL